jgi:hypothetical protein
MRQCRHPDVPGLDIEPSHRNHRQDVVDRCDDEWSEEGVLRKLAYEVIDWHVPNAPKECQEEADLSAGQIHAPVFLVRNRAIQTLRRTRKESRSRCRCRWLSAPSPDVRWPRRLRWKTARSGIAEADRNQHGHGNHEQREKHGPEQIDRRAQTPSNRPEALPAHIEKRTCHQPGQEHDAVFHPVVHVKTRAEGKNNARWKQDGEREVEGVFSLLIHRRQTAESSTEIDPQARSGCQKVREVRPKVPLFRNANV